jgi:hypothetical protein
MTLHIIKLCVGVDGLDHMYKWIAECRKGRDTLDHVTRMFPKRKDEVLSNGSLYWVIKGMILCRQPIADLEAVRGSDGIERCRIVFKPKIIPVRPTPRRAFQGWRYFTAEDAPPDLTKMAKGAVEMPEKLRRDLAELGLL